MGGPQEYLEDKRIGSEGRWGREKSAKPDDGKPEWYAKKYGYSVESNRGTNREFYAGDGHA